MTDAPSQTVRRGHQNAWNDVIQRSLYDPVLYRAVTLVQRGELTREEAMIVAALALSHMCQQQHDQLVEVISNQPPQSHRVGRPEERWR
jgi:hypothetical protein